MLTLVLLLSMILPTYPLRCCHSNGAAPRLQCLLFPRYMKNQAPGYSHPAITSYFYWVRETGSWPHFGPYPTLQSGCIADGLQVAPAA